MLTSGELDVDEMLTLQKPHQASISDPDKFRPGVNLPCSRVNPYITQTHTERF